MRKLCAMSILVTGLLLFATHDVHAYGALAVGYHPNQYGLSWGYGHPKDAASRALSECGSDCRIAVGFTGCVAYAVDRSKGSRIYGWGSSSSTPEARSRALWECRDAGGRYCVVRETACG